MSKSSSSTHSSDRREDSTQDAAQADRGAVVSGQPVGASSRFRALHAVGRLLILPNAWDVGSARLVASCGAEAIATTSAGLAWSHGYSDGNSLPVKLLEATVLSMVRVLDVPLTVDVEAGYTDDPRAAGELVVAIANAGAVGINIEDGADAPALLCAKIEAAKKAVARAGLDVFVNVRTDVYLRGLVPKPRAVEETIARARQYRDAGCDGIFVPGVAASDEIRAIVDGVSPLPLNVMAVPGLPDAAALGTLGVRRLSAGSALASATFGRVRQMVAAFLRDGRTAPWDADAIPYGEMNALFTRE